ncbi:hypothetical protein AAFF_G00183320 [Aldrovandia affinis]|uniref:Uncharacterized protein n=1 Tax=Aldrovandia affinis TaxID=143900 RepID=A0AAD7RKT4_9TELE|nr:hypothetical protein AAFF_G00183320 [Aldrovandia affinis]
MLALRQRLTDVNWLPAPPEVEWQALASPSERLQLAGREGEALSRRAQTAEPDAQPLTLQTLLRFPARGSRSQRRLIPHLLHSIGNLRPSGRLSEAGPAQPATALTTPVCPALSTRTDGTAGLLVGAQTMPPPEGPGHRSARDQRGPTMRLTTAACREGPAGLFVLGGVQLLQDFCGRRKMAVKERGRWPRSSEATIDVSSDSRPLSAVGRRGFASHFHTARPISMEEYTWPLCCSTNGLRTRRAGRQRGGGHLKRAAALGGVELPHGERGGRTLESSSPRRVRAQCFCGQSRLCARSAGRALLRLHTAHSASEEDGFSCVPECTSTVSASRGSAAVSVLFLACS